MRAVSFVGGFLMLTAGAMPSTAQDPATVDASKVVIPVGPPKSVVRARVLGIVPGVGHVYAEETTHALAFGLATYAAFAISAIGDGGVCPAPPPNAANAGRGCGDTYRISTVSMIMLAGLVGWSVHDAGEAAKRWNVRHGHQVSALIEPAIVPTRAREQHLVARIGVRMALR